MQTKKEHESHVKRCLALHKAIIIEGLIFIGSIGTFRRQFIKCGYLVISGCDINQRLHVYEMCGNEGWMICSIHLEVREMM
jgi:hypothetical protein